MLLEYRLIKPKSSILMNKHADAIKRSRQAFMKTRKTSIQTVRMGPVDGFWITPAVANGTRPPKMACFQSRQTLAVGNLFSQSPWSITSY